MEKAVLEEDQRDQADRNWAAPDPAFANWRVLLPAPANGVFHHLALFGGPEGLDRLLVELKAAERVSRSISPPCSADAVALLAGAPPSLRTVAACLKPGGALYWEIERFGAARLRLTPGRIFRALRASGFTPTGIYLIRPRSGPAEVFVPLDVSGAVAWCAGTFWRDWVGAVAALFPRCSRALAAFAAPRIAITALAEGGRDPLSSVIDRGRIGERLRYSTARPLVCFRSHSRRTVIFPFSENGRSPEAVLKFSPLRERASRTANEQQTLSEIRSRLDPEMARTIPEPMGTFQWSGLTVGMESFLPGRSVGRAASRPMVPLRKKLRDLDRVTEWLCRFQISNQFGRPAWGSAEWSLERWVEGPLRLFEREFTLTRNEERLFAATREAARALVGIPLPVVLSNWSFSLGNVCRTDDRILVYDWETVTRGLPLADLVYFLMDWGRLMRKGASASWKISFRQLLVEPRKNDRISTALQRSMARYFVELDIDPRFRPLLCVLTWVHRAERRLLKNHQASRTLDARLRALAETGDLIFAGGPVGR